MWLQTVCACRWVSISQCLLTLSPTLSFLVFTSSYSAFHTSNRRFPETVLVKRVFGCPEKSFTKATLPILLFKYSLARNQKFPFDFEKCVKISCKYRNKSINVQNAHELIYESQTVAESAFCSLCQQNSGNQTLLHNWVWVQIKYFTVFVRTGMPGPVGQLCVCCSSIKVVMLLKNSGHERQENQLHCFRALKTVITANYCQKLCWFLLYFCEFCSGLWKMIQNTSVSLFFGQDFGNRQYRWWCYCCRVVLQVRYLSWLC